MFYTIGNKIYGHIRQVSSELDYIIFSILNCVCIFLNRGRTADWYKKSYGYVCVGLLERIKDSFKQSTSGPESIV